MTPYSPRALVVGSGLSGSTAARTLADHGWFVEINEAAYFVGGHVRTAEYQGLLYEQNAIHVNHTNCDQVILFIKRFS
jgi:phytoene dehydrogenase-like protein